MQPSKAIAIVGIGALMPEAFDVPTFWKNLLEKRYSIQEVPSTRWSADAYYDPDPKALDKTYSKIGGWVEGFTFDPFKAGIAIPPRVLAQMDYSQQWGVAVAHQALHNYGYPSHPLNPERTAVILGNALGGEHHYRTSLRIYLPEYEAALKDSPEFASLAPPLQQALVDGLRRNIRSRIPEITEDTMPGELGNIIAGRIANVFNFNGPNYITDAACASSLAALQNAIDGLSAGHFDAVLTGGVDRNMGVEGFVKFCKIGALSPDGSRPYADGANGFVMGEGAAVFLLKRLADAEKDGDTIYAVIRGIGGSSDGKGKGITAPNPSGQVRAIQRAWKDASLNPATAGMIEGHGTSTRVGDVVEFGSLMEVFGSLDLPAGKVALGSVKSNIGHLKSAAGAAGLLKAVLALHHRIFPPIANFERPNPNIDFTHSPFYPATEAREWQVKSGEVRRAGVSSFGFGGTNFHIVVEEYRPGMLTGERIFPTVEVPAAAAAPLAHSEGSHPPVLRPLAFFSAPDPDTLKNALAAALEAARTGTLPPSQIPPPAHIRQPERLAIDYDNIEDFIKKAEKSLKAFEGGSAGAWSALTAQGIFRGTGSPGKLAFLFPGQGSQYVNMLADLKALAPVVAQTFNEADAVMTPILGKPLTSFIFVQGDEAALAQAEKDLKNTTITQPAVLTANVAILRLLAQYGYQPDMVIGHSLGEYAALVAAGVLPFPDALQIVSARGQEMTKVSVADPGCMAAVSAPLPEVERVLKEVQGYAVIANINSPYQSVIGGETAAIESALAAFGKAGLQASKIPVSHAFHTRIVAPASEPLKQVIASKVINPPRLPVVANVTGTLYPSDREQIIDLLGAQVASPVQFIRGMNTLYESGARIFIESGPKRVLNALATDNLKDRPDVTILATNHPRKGGIASFNEALCGLLAAGVEPFASPQSALAAAQPTAVNQPAPQPAAVAAPVYSGGQYHPTGSVVISGAGVGLPGRSRHVFAEDNIQRILDGQILIEPLPESARTRMLEKRVTRLVKSEAGAVMQIIDDLDQTVKLAGQGGEFDLEAEFGIPAERVEALDVSTRLAIAAGIDALRDAGIPLVMNYRQTSKGTLLPDRWMLPPALADETGVIFGSAFPGLERMAAEARSYFEYQALAQKLEELRMLQLAFAANNEVQAALAERIAAAEAEMAASEYQFDRRFIFRILAMGHSQFAEHIGARGPNTHVNAACATTTHALSVAEDWIRTGRARRVIVISGDDVSTGELAGWVGTGLMASGAATTEGNPRQAILPFDRRRNGMIMGMGAAALVVESEDALRERGMCGICEVLATITANSAFHGTRLNIQHVTEVMENLLQIAEARYGLRRQQIAPQTVFVSHETYTPARGGSAAAEIHALRQVFGSAANQVVIANTKGFTGHTMGVGVEDVVAVKALEKQIVPPIANIQDGFEPDPDLGDLNLSKGGAYPVEYALRLGAGFGSQIAMSLLRRIPGLPERVDRPRYQQWLEEISGTSAAELEVVQHTLRVVHKGAPQKAPAQSAWKYGTPPALWVSQVSPAAAPVEAPIIPQPAATHHPDPAPSAPPIVAPASSASRFEEIKARVLALVSEKTGYPVEMLDLDLDLEADLGIDTVKQAELFAAVRTSYNIPRREDLRLSDYNTLAKVIGFIQSGLGEAPPLSQPVKAAEPTQSVTPQNLSANIALDRHPSPGNEEVQARVLALVSEKTGYPVEMLDLDLDLEADLGIDTVKQAELFAAVRTSYNIPRREDLRLSDYNTLAKVIGFIHEALPAPSVSTPTPQPTEPVALPTPAAEEDSIRSHVLAVVSDKTGYPQEMLDLDLDLEADLGIDTVKQAELFAAIRTHYGIPRREDLRLSDYNTLAKVISFIQDGIARQQAAAAPQPESTPPAPQPTATQSTAILRRVPALTLRPRLDLCTPTGQQLDQMSRVLIISEPGKPAEALIKKLRALGVNTLRLSAAELPSTAKLAEFLTQGAVQGAYFLNLQSAPDLKNLTAETWQSEVSLRAEALYYLVRTVPGMQFLVCAVPENHPFNGLVRGFAKSLAWEQKEMLIKVIEFPSSLAAPSLAARLIEETVQDPGAVEICWQDSLRFSRSLIESPLPAHVVAPLNEGTVFLVTGATGGIIAPILRHLASRTLGVFHLFGRSPLPSADDPDLLHLKADRALFAKEIHDRLAHNGEKPTPVQVEAKLSALERLAALREAIDQITHSGAQAYYHTCELTNPASVHAAVSQVIQRSGRVDVLLHAAGYERSRKLESKPLEEFRQVISVKANGFFHTFSALQAANALPAQVVMFSSVAGFFGNSGQADYAAANDFLSTLAKALPQQFDGMRTVSIDWGAWAEVGMAARGNTPRLMQLAGIDMLPPSAAAPLVAAELIHNPGESEVIVAGSLGILSTPGGRDGGMDLQTANSTLTRAGAPHIMLSRLSGYSLQGGITLEAELDPASQPFLRDHALNGIPVLPGVMGIEGFSVAARHVASSLAGSDGGFTVQSMEDIRFLAPFKFYRNEPRRITWKAQVIRSAAGLVAHVTLESDLLLATKKVEHMLHFSARVNLIPAAEQPPAQTVTPPNWNGAYTVGAQDIYKIYFHGPSFQVLEGVQRVEQTVLGKFRKDLPPLAAVDGAVPPTPLLVELVFQTAGIWQAGATGVLALPGGIGRLTLYKPQVNGEAVFAVVTPGIAKGGEMFFDARVVDAKGQLYLELQKYTTSPLPYTVEEDLVRPLRPLVQS